MSIRNRADDGETNMLEFVDPDITSISRFLAGDMSASEAAAFDERLADDAAFFDKALPLLAIHVTPINFDAVEKLAAEAEREHVAAETVALAESRATHPRPHIPVSASPRRAPRARTAWAVAKWTLGSGMAAATIYAVSIGFDPEIQQVAANDALARGTAVATSAASKNVELTNASLVSLQPNGFVGYPAAPASDGTLRRVMQWLMPQKVLPVYLTGSATIDMPATAGLIDVVTSAGTVTLEADGVYDVTSTTAPERATVFVRRGRATLVPGDRSAPVIILRTGEWGTLHGMSDTPSFDSTIHQPQPGAPR